MSKKNYYEVSFGSSGSNKKSNKENWCSSASFDSSLEILPIDLSAKSSRTKLRNAALALADHNYSTSYEKQKIENLGIFEKILQIHENNDTIEIEKFHTTRGMQSNKCQNYTFCGRQVQDFVKHVVVKRNPTKNEKKAYQKVFPVLEKSKVNPWPVPKYSFRKNMIILDNLSVEGFWKTDNKVLTLEECYLVLSNLAQFHAASLLSQFRNPVEFQVLQISPKESTHGAFLAYLNNLSGKKIFNKIFNNTEVESLEVLINQAKTYSQAKFTFSAVCHGNLLPTNIFFKENEVQFLDFKQMHYGSIARDVICFMIVNLEPKNYFTCFHYLLDHYIELLIRSGKLDIDLNISYALIYNSFKEDVSKVAAYGVLYSIWSMPVLYANSDPELKTLRTILDNTAENFCPDFVDRIKTMLTLYHDRHIKQRSN